MTDLTENRIKHLEFIEGTPTRQIPSPSSASEE